MIDTEKQLNRERARDFVKTLADAGNSLDYIVLAIRREGIPTLSGRPGTKWSRDAVAKIAAEAGTRIEYRPSV